MCAVCVCAVCVCVLHHIRQVEQLYFSFLLSRGLSSQHLMVFTFSLNFLHNQRPLKVQHMEPSKTSSQYY